MSLDAIFERDRGTVPPITLPGAHTAQPENRRALGEHDSSYRLQCGLLALLQINILTTFYRRNESILATISSAVSEFFLQSRLISAACVYTYL